jgi:undecaprenyl-diphosphatase
MWQKLSEMDNRLSGISRLGVNHPVTRTLAVILAHSGDSWFWLLGLILLWWQGTDYWKARAVALAVGILVTAMVVMIIKFSVRRSRPEGEWGQIYRSTDPHSFPSGHAARSMMLAVIALGLGPLWLGLLLLAWAPLVSLARVMLGVHYPSDVIAGMGLGALLGFIVLQIF